MFTKHPDTMKRKDGFVLRTVCGEKVLAGEGLDAIDFNRLVRLNDTAAWLWEEAGAQEEFSAETLTDALCRTYEVGRETARADVEKLLSQWKALGIIV